jgi:hypothetical protein
MITMERWFLSVYYPKAYMDDLREAGGSTPLVT